MKILFLEKFFVIGGGIFFKEVIFKIMESKLVNGLFFVGEFLDINGYIGGYNVIAVFVIGYVVGFYVVEIVEYIYLLIEEV